MIVSYSNKYKGKGVFANKKFEVGEVVNRSKLRKIKWATFEKYSPNQKRLTMIWNNQPYTLDKITRYINHSCSPNTKSIATHSDKDGIDVAIKKINIGDEITANYLPKVKIGINCKCGSKKCKKTILDKGLILQSQ